MQSNLKFKPSDLDYIRDVIKYNNDNNPFRNKRGPSIPFGTKIVNDANRFSRRFPWTMAAAALIWYLDRKYGKKQFPRKNGNLKWKQDVAPNLIPWNYLDTNDGGPFFNQFRFGVGIPFDGIIQVFGPFPKYWHFVGNASQSPDSAEALNDPIWTDNSIWESIAPFPNPTPDVYVPDLFGTWNGLAPSPQPQADPAFPPEDDIRMDPNIRRRLADPYARPLPPYVPDPFGGIADIPFSSVMQTGGYETSRTPSPSPFPSQPVTTPRPVTPRQPPRKNEKESKTRHQASRFGVALFKALDMVSEGAERVDAVFQALPKDVRDKYERRFKRAGGLSVDKAGQYGMDGADWKLRALWNNWDKVDVVAATYNLAKNEIEDKLYGAAFKARKSATLHGRQTNGLPEILRRKRKAVRR